MSSTSVAKSGKDAEKTLALLAYHADFKLFASKTYMLRGQKQQVSASASASAKVAVDAKADQESTLVEYDWKTVNLEEIEKKIGFFDVDGAAHCFCYEGAKSQGLCPPCRAKYCWVCTRTAAKHNAGCTFDPKRHHYRDGFYFVEQKLITPPEWFLIDLPETPLSEYASKAVKPAAPLDSDGKAVKSEGKAGDKKEQKVSQEKKKAGFSEVPKKEYHWDEKKVNQIALLIKFHEGGPSHQCACAHSDSCKACDTCWVCGGTEKKHRKNCDFDPDVHEWRVAYDLINHGYLREPAWWGEDTDSNSDSDSDSSASRKKGTKRKAETSEDESESENESSSSDEETAKQIRQKKWQKAKAESARARELAKSTKKD